jgi:hypothetical protein
MNIAELMLVINLTVMMMVSIVGFMYVARALKEIHAALNSRLSALLEATTKIAHTAGVEEERGKER